jgi:hypothetical protein
MAKGKGLHALITSHRADKQRLDKYKIFKDAVIDAFDDGILTRDEASILDGIRHNLGLSEEERDVIYDDAKDQLGIEIQIEGDECIETEEVSKLKAEILELKHRLSLAETEASQAEWLIEEAQKEVDEYKEEGDVLRKHVNDLETRIDVLEVALEKAGVKVKKRPITKPMPPRPKGEEDFWEVKKRQVTEPVARGKVVKKIAVCAFCGVENQVKVKQGETEVFACQDCGKKSFVSDL